MLEIFFDAAIKQAETLDEHFATTGSPKGPLHGLPISLKDQFHVKGVETSMGYVGWLGTFQGKKGTGHEKVFESEMVKELATCGAVFYCKTSVPHTLMSGETINNIVGYAWNPKNRHLSSGGSSGGEGALIGLKGSPLGFGTDIGGSIRIPAAVNGLYGIRPSAGRLPYEGMANSMDGQNSILSVVGPLSHSAESLELVTKAILSQEPWLHDPLVVELPWRSEQAEQILALAESPKKLAFGILKHDGKVSLHPPMRRALDMTAKALEKLGHKIIDWNPPSHQHLEDIALATWMYDGGADVHAAFGLSGEPPADQVSSVYGHEPRGEALASKIATTNVAKREAQKQYMEYWNSTAGFTGTGRPVDAIIAPCSPFAAARPKTHVYVGYTMFVNVLDYTAVVVPVTNCDKNVDVKDDDYKPLNEQDQLIMKSCESYPLLSLSAASSCSNDDPRLTNAVSLADDPEVYDGAHVALQLVGRRFQEEKILALAGYVGKALHG